MQIHPLISDSASLAKFCARISASPFVAVDTEFMRENTYWPELCLIQLSDGNEAAAICPMTDGIDLSPILDLLCDNEEVIKVFHAGSQDIEIFYNLTGRTPHPIFDTQIASMALGQGEQIGYSNLVERWLGIHADKGARFTDWSRRPLDQRQIDYAIGDVTHLSTIFPKMVERLRKTGRGAWLDAEMEKLADAENYRIDPENVWRRIKISSRKPDVLGRLKALASWREREAQAKNLPRGRIAKDEALADIAAHPPKAQHDLSKVRGLSQSWGSNEIGGRLMAALTRAEPLKPEDLPPRDDRGPSPGKEGALIADLLKLLLKIRAREISIAPRLLARSEELEALAAGQRENLSLLEDWRYEQFGRDALALVEGQLGFAVRNGKLHMTRTNGDGE